MSYHEKRAIVSLISTILISVAYFVYVLQRYPEGNSYSADVFRFWGLAILIFMPVTTVARIVLHIVFSIVNAVATNEKEPAFSDERDRLIGLRATRNALYVFLIGYFLAMVSLVIEMPPSAMFIILVFSGLVSGTIVYTSQFYYYRRGF